MIGALRRSRDVFDGHIPVRQPLPHLPRQPDEVTDAICVLTQFLAEASFPEQRAVILIDARGKIVLTGCVAQRRIELVGQGLNPGAFPRHSTRVLLLNGVFLLQNTSETAIGRDDRCRSVECI